MNIINLTPHTINETLTGQSFQPSGSVARLDSSLSAVNTVNGIPLYKKVFGEIKNLPPKTPNTLYIVSGIMLEAGKYQGRDDLVAPGDLVRDSKGQPIGCRGFVI